MTRYIAKRRLHLGGGVYADVGDDVRDAVNWPNLRAYVGDFLEVIEGEDAPVIAGSPIDSTEGMSAKAAVAFTAFVALGDGRTIDALAEQYVVNGTYKDTAIAGRVLAKWAIDYRWDDRIAALSMSDEDAESIQDQSGGGEEADGGQQDEATGSDDTQSGANDGTSTDEQEQPHE